MENSRKQVMASDASYIIGRHLGICYYVKYSIKITTPRIPAAREKKSKFWQVS